MKRFLSLFALLLVGSALAQMSVNIASEGYWHCVPTGTNHNQEKDAIEACTNAALAEPGVPVYIEPPRYRVIAEAEAQLPILLNGEGGAGEPVGEQPAAGLLSDEDFTYLGAFKMPTTWAADNKHFAYSNGAIGYWPEGNGGAGSLLATGHPYATQAVAEIAIPTLLMEEDPDDLNAGTYVGTPFLDILPSGGGGALYHMAYNPDDELMYFTYSGDYVDYSNPPPALGRIHPDRTTSSEGMWYMGTVSAHNYARTMSLIPSAWASSVGLPTRRFIQEGNRGSFSQGPTTHIWSPPESLAPDGTISDYDTVALYDNPGFGDNTISDYNPRNLYKGMAWVTSSTGKQAILISGLKHFQDPEAPYPDGYYGYANWVLPAECEPFENCPAGGRGHRAAEVRPGWWLFDPAEYAAVLAEEKELYEVDFYDFSELLGTVAYRTFEPTFLTTGTSAETYRMAWDEENRRLFVSEAYAVTSQFDGVTVPLVHVFQVD